MSRRLQELIEPSKLPMALHDLPITGLAYRVEDVQPGMLFAAWQGSRTDGHGYIEQAVQQGACLILAEREVPCTVPLLVLPQVRSVYAEAVWRWSNHPDRDFQLVGITGTNGKTTTTHMLAAIWQAAGIKTGHVGTLGCFDGLNYLNNPWTTPDAAYMAQMLRHMADKQTRAVVLEMSSQALDQARLWGMSLDVTAFLNLSQDHLDAHGTMEAYAAAKMLLLDYLKPQGIAVINRDCPTFGRIERPNSLGFSCQIQRTPPQGLVQCCLAQAPQLDVEGITCWVWAQQPEPVCLFTPLMGQFQVANLLASVTCAMALQLPVAAWQQGLAAVGSVPGRLQKVSLPSQPLVWVDYAHTPDALVQVLQSVRPWIKGRLMVIIGCGGERDPSKRGPMALAAANHADVCVLTSDNPRSEDPQQILRTMEAALGQQGLIRREQLDHPACYGCWSDRKEAIERTIGQLKPEDGLLIAGKGHETYQIIGHQRLPFDDRLIARQALAASTWGR